MNRKSLTISVVAGSLLLAACAGQQGDKQKIGGILGAAGGAVAGAQMGNGKGRLAAVAAGTLLGALVGSSIGQSMDELDRLKAQQTTETALETVPDGRDSTWINPNSGNSGTVTPTRTYYDQESQPCREYQSVATIGGETQQVYGTACRQADGSWRVVQ